MSRALVSDPRFDLSHAQVGDRIRIGAAEMRRWPEEDFRLFWSALVTNANLFGFGLEWRHEISSDSYVIEITE